MSPLSLSDDQMDAVMRAAAPLHPADRSAFLERMAERLRGVEILGDGLVSRIAREVQREFFRPPDLGNPRRLGAGKYR
jgi:hypothetical protein